MKFTPFSKVLFVIGILAVIFFTGRYLVRSGVIPTKEGETAVAKVAQDGVLTYNVGVVTWGGMRAENTSMRDSKPMKIQGSSKNMDSRLNSMF